MELIVKVGDQATTLVHEPAATPRPRGLFLFAHGAGADRAHPSMQRASEALRGIGLDVARFNFLYRERGSRRPDPMPLLKACLQAVAAKLPPHQRLILGGRSMGGRVASMLVAEGMACDALLLLAYPLHPAGKPGKLRDAHLPAIRVPVLCMNGTKDELCRRDLMDATVARIKTPWAMHWLDGKRHSFDLGPAEAAAIEKWLLASLP